MSHSAGRPVTVLVPRTLMSATGDQRRLQVPFELGGTVGRLLDVLAVQYPLFDRRLRDETGALRRYVNLYVDGEEVRRLRGVATEIRPGQEVRIIQSVAGGAGVTPGQRLAA